MGCKPRPNVAEGTRKTADGWLDTTPTEPPVLNNSMRAMLGALGVTANCRGMSRVAFVPTSSGVKVAARVVFRTWTVREMRVWVRTLVPRSEERRVGKE